MSNDQVGLTLPSKISTLAEAKEKLKPRFGEKTSEIVDSYAKVFPENNQSKFGQ